MELSFLLGWAVTATIAAIWYALKEQATQKRMLWNVKMLLKMASNEAKVTREGGTLTFHYENEFESNTIKVQVR